MNARTQIDPSAPRSAYPVEHTTQQAETVTAYLDAAVEHYRRSCYLEDLTCARLAAIWLCREVRLRVGSRMTYKAARQLLNAQ